MEITKISDETFQKLLDNSLEIINFNDFDSNISINIKQDYRNLLDDPNSLTCSYCCVTFLNRDEQHKHYKCNWHIYNVKQSLNNKPSMNEKDFYMKMDNCNISNISSSDSDNDNDYCNINNYSKVNGKIFLKTINENVIALYSCLISVKMNNEINNNILRENLHYCTNTNTKWTILMLGGGHFAGAIFEENEPILHKTFHTYTVRAGQGSAQSSKDNKSSYKSSAGASLRRYNEQSLIHNVKEIVKSWEKDIEESSLIFIRASGPFNQAILFGGNSSPLFNKNDERIRSIPFSTKRATFSEIKRVHSVLVTVIIFENINLANDYFIQQNQQMKIVKKETCKDKEIKNNGSNSDKNNSNSDSDNDDDDDDDGDNEEIELSITNTEIKFDLKEFETSLPVELKKPFKKKPVRKSKNKKIKEREEKRLTNILSILIEGNISKLNDLLNEKLISINEFLDQDQNTPLHIVALHEHLDCVKCLMENSADPCLKNKQQKTPYTLTKSNDIRNYFRQFAKDNPTKFNYNKANIPTNALNNEQIQEKKKFQRQIKKQKEKIKKQENILNEIEEKEKQQFLNLTDHEKQNLPNIVRCFLCGSLLNNKRPFEYSKNYFCSIDCLKLHRCK